MISYDINDDQTVCVKIKIGTSAEEMKELAFTVDALTEGNPNISIRFQLQQGLSFHLIKKVERLCENISNNHYIEQAPSLI